MLRHIRRYFAVRSYVFGLSQQLPKLPEGRRWYSVKQVSAAIAKHGYNRDFTAYAHAIFCSREDFDAHYTPLRVRCTYDGLRLPVARRYMERDYRFSPQDVMRKFRRSNEDGHYESGIGMSH